MFSWLFGKKDDPEQEDVASDDPVITLHFNINSEGQIHIETQWSASTEDYAKALGRLLFVVNEGAFKADIINLLQEYVKETPDSTAFISAVIAQWSKLVQEKERNKNEQEDLPLVEPEGFFSNDKKKDD